MGSTTYATLVKLDKKFALVLCRAVAGNGERFCVYLRARKADVKQLQQAYQRGQAVTFDDYGKILWHGWCHDPPPEVREQLLRLESAS